MDHQEFYLATLFGFQGVTDIRFLRAESVNISPEQKQKALVEAKREVAHLVAAREGLISKRSVSAQ
jgi:FMN-dependent NADH-azoreductase